MFKKSKLAVFFFLNTITKANFLESLNQADQEYYLYFLQKNTIMKSVFLLLIVAVCLCRNSFAQHSLTRLWETDTLLKIPESVLFDAENKILYVSNIDGTDPWAKDGKGSIGKVGLDGKIIATEWVTGLNAMVVAI